MGEYLNVTELEKATPWSKGTISRHLNAGVVPEEYSKTVDGAKGKKVKIWDVDKVIEFFNKNKDNSRPKSKVAKQDEGSSKPIDKKHGPSMTDIQKARETRKIKILDLKIAQMEGRLLDREKTLNDIAEAATVFKTKVYDFCERTSPILAGMTDVQEIRNYQRKEMNSCLQAISDWFENGD